MKKKELIFHKGAITGLNEAIKAQTTTHCCFENKISVSGTVASYLSSNNKDINFIKWSGPVQICHQGIEIDNQGTKRHPDGFSCPIGSWKGLSSPPSKLQKKKTLLK